MKTPAPALLLSLALAFTTTVALHAGSKNKSSHGSSADDPEAATPSIHVRGKLKPSERLALAKISFPEAMSAALAAAPGRMVYGELDVEDGNLVFDFLIFDAHRRPIEVQVDAGNGRVLDVDEGDDE